MLVQDAEVQMTYVETALTLGQTALYVIRLSTENHQDRGTCSTHRGYENFIKIVAENPKQKISLDPDVDGGIIFNGSQGTE